MGERWEKIAAAQADKNRQCGQIIFRAHIFDDAIFDVYFLCAVVALIFQVNVFGGADGNIQHVNASEIVAGFGFEIDRAFSGTKFIWRRNAERENIGFAGGIFHDVQFTEIETQKRNVNFFFRERGAVVFNVDFRNLQKWRAAKFRRVEDFQVLNFEGRFGQTQFDPANFRVHSGLCADVMFDDDAQNGIERQEKNDRQNDGQNKQPQQPFENEFEHSLIR